MNIALDLLAEESQKREAAEIKRILDDPDELVSAVDNAFRDQRRELFAALGDLVRLDTTPAEKNLDALLPVIEEISEALKEITRTTTEIIQDWINRPDKN